MPEAEDQSASAEAPGAPQATARALDRFERWVDRDEWPTEPPPPETLDHLFRLALNRALRTGPAGLAPSRLLGFAEAAAAQGQVPLETPSALRRIAGDALSTMRDAGAWAASAPAWWEPLPQPGPVETTWRSASVSYPAAAELQAAFARGADGFLVMRELLSMDRVRTVHAELEQALARGVLRLERAGVGRGDQIRDVRTDASCYIDGTEAGLMAVAPHLTALVRQLLVTAPGALGSSSAAPLFAPQRVMLARYQGPTAGFRKHVDNPGGEHDNGRVRTLTLYLSDPEAHRRGGDLAIWRPGAPPGREPDCVVTTDPGRATLFDARTAAHEVLPLEQGSRWALVVWLNETPQRPRRLEPMLSADDLLRPIADPPAPPGRVLFHELDSHSGGRITVWTPKARPRIGIVSTVFGAADTLENWCLHHLEAGADHLILVFDRLEQSSESQTAGKLRAAFPEHRLTVWSGRQVQRERWPKLPEDPRLADPRRVAVTGDSSYAVASRQMLNASCALAAARTGRFGGEPLDWLVHLDADELLTPEQPGRGGSTLHPCFSAADQAGYSRLRFVNHEWLPSSADSPCFKMNPHLAAALLGPLGWGEVVRHLGLDPEGPRPWFSGYSNGKSAIFVAAGHIAAGVHGWYPKRQAADVFLAGPAVLHFHLTTATAFRNKYLRKARFPTPTAQRLFRPSPVEEVALGIVNRGQKQEWSEREISSQLDRLHAQYTAFTGRDREILSDAGLLINRKLAYPLLPPTDQVL